MAISRSNIPKQLLGNIKGPQGPNPAKGNRVAAPKQPVPKVPKPTPFKKGGMAKKGYC